MRGVSEVSRVPLGSRLPYPEYRNSGVEWIGEIPAHWRLKSLKHSVARLESGGTPVSDNTTYWTDEEHGIPWLAISDMTRGFHVYETAKRITEEGRRSKRLTILPAGTLLYSMYASLGKVAVLEIAAVVNQAILGVVPREGEVLRDYLRWWFEFMQPHVPMLSSSNTQDNLSAERVRNMPVVVPMAVDEQRGIAAFLDRETAKIDALVAKKERLIELLQEKRTALLTRAVTRGLDPTVPVKDSGVPWLGDIPAHWNVGPLRLACQSIETGGTPSVDFVDDEGTGRVDWFAPGDFVDNLVLRNSARKLTQEAVSLGKARLFPASSVFVVGIGATLGKVGLIEEPASSNQQINVLIPRADVDPRFLASVLRGLGGVMTMMANSATLPILNQHQIGAIQIPIPPTLEQRQIASTLARETHRMSDIRLTAKRTIDFLNEYRTALISAAVTGKIDVRKEAA